MTVPPLREAFFVPPTGLTSDDWYAGSIAVFEQVKACAYP